MRKCFLIVRSNIRKAKGQTASIIVLILIAALMLNLWLMLSMDYKANFDRYHDKFHAEHVTLSVDGDTDEVQSFLSKTIESDSRTAAFRLDHCMHMTGSFTYNGGKMQCWFVFLDKQTALTRSIGRIEIVEEGTFTSGVYLPMIYKTSDITVGNQIEISIGSNMVTYTVCGFFNSIMLGSNNCALTEIVLTEDKYIELETSGYAPYATLCSVRLNDKSENLNYEAELKSTVSEQYPNILMVSNCYDNVTQARYISQMICSGIIAAMAFFVLLIALVVIVSNIINYMQVNMKNLGALKAVGYTSKQLIYSLLFQFLSLTFIAALVGAGLSYFLFPTVNTMMIAQTGIPYTMHFLPLPLVISLAVLGGTVALAVWFSSRKIKKIEPIVALRSGIQTHNFKRNHIPLEKTKSPLNFALAFKTTLSGIKYNITVCITMLVLSLVVVFSGLMIENVITNMTPFLNLIVGETADSCINVQVETEDNFLREMNADIRVEKVYLYNSLNVSHVGGVELMAMLCDDFSKINNQNVVFDGRFPRYDNEIAIAAKYAKENGLKIGDEIEITANGKQEKYLITGFTQISNNLGKDCLLTRAGYERLGTLTNTSYYINLVDETDIDEFNLEMKEKFDDSINTTINVDATMKGAASVYISLMTIIVIAIFAFSAIIIVFVLYLLVRTMLNNKNRDYGIMKALGFTTGQLILQTALSFMPTTILSTGIGLIVCSLIINPLTALFLSSIGIVKCTFALPVGFIVIAGIGLILFAFAMACLLSLKIRKITPRALLSEE
ncbi:MAG: FtsX-like permease family protein [Lachnospiraceae bacterium]|nr:FtsX-like permease family protein [Lachnospiraceae bacterium]